MSKGRSDAATHSDVQGGDRTDGSPMDVFEDRREPRRWPGVVGLLLAVVVVLAGAYVAAAWSLADRVPTGATVAGVEIGGLDEAAAVERLEDTLGPVATGPVPVQAGERRTTLDPAAAGLAMDAQATVADLTGFSLDPARLWQHAFGAAEVEPVTTIDRDLLGPAVEALDDSLRTEPVDGTVGFVDGEAVSTEASEGASLDVTGAREVLEAGWLTAARPLVLPTETLEPAITDEEVARALREIARPVAGAPVGVVVGEQVTELPASVVTGAAEVAPVDGTLELRLDGEVLTEAVLARTTDLLSEATDARFVFEEGRPVVVPGVAGSTLDPEQVAQAVGEAATGTDRTARLELVEVDPERTTEALEALGVNERVSEFSTEVTADADRTHNLALGASKVNGTLILPGEVFSLNEVLSPITAAAGYRSAGVVVSGVLQEGVGGGLSQMGTTVYNAGFFAGLEDVEHRPHSFYFSRYPEGREATIYGDVLDVKIGNNTPYGVLLQSWVGGGRLHVAAWSTPYWTVEHSTSGRSEVVQPTTVYNTSSGCISQSAGSPGFRVTVHRRLLLDGEVQHTESNSWRYQPQNRIVCGPPPSERPAPSPSPPADEADEG